MRLLARHPVRIGMRALVCLALVACSGDPPPPPPAPPLCPTPALPQAASKGELDLFVWRHTSPTLDANERQWEIERQEADDVAAAARRARQARTGLGRETTHLTVTVLDDYLVLPAPGSTQLGRCAPGARHRLDIVLDGVPVGAIDVPCTESMQAPPRAFEPPAFDVPPGVHRIRIREAETGVSAVRDYVFPEIGDDFMLDHIQIWADEHSFRMDDLARPGMML